MYIFIDNDWLIVRWIIYSAIILEPHNTTILGVTEEEVDDYFHTSQRAFSDHELHKILVAFEKSLTFLDQNTINNTAQNSCETDDILYDLKQYFHYLNSPNWYKIDPTDWDIMLSTFKLAIEETTADDDYLTILNITEYIPVEEPNIHIASVSQFFALSHAYDNALNVLGHEKFNQKSNYSWWGALSLLSRLIHYKTQLSHTNPIIPPSNYHLTPQQHHTITTVFEQATHRIHHNQESMNHDENPETNPNNTTILENFTNNPKQPHDRQTLSIITHHLEKTLRQNPELANTTNIKTLNHLHTTLTHTIK